MFLKEGEVWGGVKKMEGFFRMFNEMKLNCQSEIKREMMNSQTNDFRKTRINAHALFPKVFCRAK